MERQPTQRCGVAWCAVLCCCLALRAAHLVCCVLKAHPVADQAPQRHAHLISDPLSDRHGRDAPRLRAHHLVRDKRGAGAV